MTRNHPRRISQAISSAGTDHRIERPFDAVGVELKAHAEGIVGGRRTARAAEEWRNAIEHERSTRETCWPVHITQFD